MVVLSSVLVVNDSFQIKCEFTYLGTYTNFNIHVFSCFALVHLNRKTLLLGTWKSRSIARTDQALAH